MDNEKNPLEFHEDSFDLGSHKKAAKEVSRKKLDAKRANRHISVGKALLTVAALAVFILLFFVVMHALGLDAVY